MYPQRPLPRHITALYVVAVASCVALFGHGVALVGADVLVYSIDYHEEPEMEFKDLPAQFGDPIPIEGLKVCGQSRCRGTEQEIDPMIPVMIYITVSVIALRFG